MNLEKTAPINQIHRDIAAMVCPIFADGRLRATGFFYSYSKQVFLITNKHAIMKENISIKVIEIETFFSTPDTRFWLNAKKRWKIDLYNNENRKIWREFAPNIDLVGIPVNIPSDCHIQQFTEKDLPSENLIFTPNNNVFVPNYGVLHSKDIYQQIGNAKLPTYKGGTIASCLVEPLSLTNIFFIDLQSIPGNSGSPVLFLEPTGKFGHFNLRLFGIVASGFVQIPCRNHGPISPNTTIAISSSFLKKI